MKKKKKIKPINKFVGIFSETEITMSNKKSQFHGSISN